MDIIQGDEFLQFEIQDGLTFVIPNPAVAEYDNPKYYLLDIGGSDLTVLFKCNCPIKKGYTVQIFSGPTVTDMGILMTESQPLADVDVYQNTTVSNEGSQIHSHVCGSVITTDNFIFTAGVDYLIKLTPKFDLSKIVYLS
jgi:hypothetical protein